MKLLNDIFSNTTDVIVVAVGACIITTFSFLFYADINKRLSVGDQEVVGTISYKKKVTQRKYSAQVVWEDIAQNTPVYNYDSIRTSDLSEAVITLNDGTQINIDENSMILLAFNKDQFNIEFSYGSLLANRDDIAGTDIKKLNIKSDQATISMDKGDVKLDQVQNKDLNVTVNKGEAAITTAAGTEQTIDQNQKVVLAKGSDDITLYKLSLRLLEPAGNASFLTQKDERQIKFGWEEVPGENKVYLEISKDRSFSDLEEEEKISGSSAEIDLNVGAYYWRIKAVNRVTDKTEYSDTRKFSIIYDDPLQLISPSDEEVFSYRTAPPIIHFKWNKSETAQSYRFFLAKDSSMKNIIKKIEVPEDTVALDNLPHGSYSWKIEKVLGLKGVTTVSGSKIFRFSITQKQTVDAPVLLYPPENKKISLKQLEITFTWKNDQQVRESKFYLAKDRNFKNVLFSEESGINFIKFEKELPVGEYYWKVVGTIEDNEFTAPSPVRAFRVIKAETINLILPAGNQTVTAAEGETTATVRFTWERSDIRGKYKIQISEDEDFSKIFKETLADSNSLPIPNFKAGKYYWRVALHEAGQEDQDPLLASGVQTFSVGEKLGAPMVIFPRSGHVVDMIDKNDLALDWEDVRGANLYRVELYRIKDGKEIPVANIRVQSSKVKITDLRKLDIGRFRWTVTAMESPDGERISREGKTVQNDFEIILGKGMEKIDIKSIEVDTL